MKLLEALDGDVVSLVATLNQDLIENPSDDPEVLGLAASELAEIAGGGDDLAIAAISHPDCRYPVKQEVIDYIKSTADSANFEHRHGSELDDY